MKQFVTAIERYEANSDSVKKAIMASEAFKNLPSRARVVIKPNIVFWSKVTDFPKWGVITTARVIEDIVILLKDMGAESIAIVEGIMRLDPKDKEVATHAYRGMGFDRLHERYGVTWHDAFERPFKKVNVGDDIELEVNQDLLEADFVVNAPVLKTHVQTVISLGMKNLKGVLSINSRKKCHGADPNRPLDFMISRLPNMLPPSATVIDGIYSLERGPSFDGKPHRMNLIIASPDILSADMVGARILGQNPAGVPHLSHAAKAAGRPTDLSDIQVAGIPVEEVAKPHEVTFEYNESGTLPLKLEKMGIKGISYRKYDHTMCTYCSGINGAMLMAIAMAWKGKPWDGVEVLNGKIMQPTPGMKKTILLGKCMSKLHKDNPVIQEAIAIKGCPPDPKDACEALHKAGIMVEPAIFANLEMGGAYFMARYQGKSEFDPGFFRTKE